MRRMVVFLGSLILLAGCQNKTLMEQTRRIEKLEAENRDLKGKVDQQMKEIERLAAATPRVVEQPQASKPLGAKDPFLRVEDTAAYQNLSRSLDESNRQVGELRPRLKALEDQIQATTQENQKLAAAQGELSAQLSKANESLDAGRKEVLARDGKLAELEAANRKLRNDVAAQGQKGSQLAKILGEIEEIERRREAAANNILSRYRDVTEQFRNVAFGMDGRRTSEGVIAPPVDLSRIQQLIALADEDLRNLRNLNAQAARAQRKLTAAK
ncbi:MAG: lipoprotein [Bryobacteraceae bacterium]